MNWQAELNLLLKKFQSDVAKLGCQLADATVDRLSRPKRATARRNTVTPVARSSVRPKPSKHKNASEAKEASKERKGSNTARAKAAKRSSVRSKTDNQAQESTARCERDTKPEHEANPRNPRQDQVRPSGDGGKSRRRTRRSRVGQASGDAVPVSAAEGSSLQVLSRRMPESGSNAPSGQADDPVHVSKAPEAQARPGSSVRLKRIQNWAIRQQRDEAKEDAKRAEEEKSSILDADDSSGSEDFPTAM